MTPAEHWKKGLSKLERPSRAMLLRKLPLLNLPRYLRERAEWRRKGGQITRSYRILDDYGDHAGDVRGHYFHQDLLVAGFIARANPERHVDIGSRVDGFVAHVAAFREIEVFDIRALDDCGHPNIHFVQSDLMQHSEENITDSLSCLHSIEHFGLGRYGDPIDPQGHRRGTENLVRMVKTGGTFYFSFPIGASDQVHFNAHRVFHPQSVLGWEEMAGMELQRFDWVDDRGRIHMDTPVEAAVGAVRYGCGIYTFCKQAS